MATMLNRANSVKVPFNTVYAIVVAALVFYGFGHTVGGALVHFTARPPAILYLHVLLTSLWVVLFVVQTALVGAKHSRLHRRIGPWGVALGAAVIVVGLVAVIVMRQRSLVIHGSTPARIAFLSIPLGSLLSFAIPFTAAAILRRRPALHRPLVLIAATTMTIAALSRVPWMPTPMLLGIPYGLMIMAAVHDSLAHHRQVSRAWLVGIPGIMALQFVAIILAFAAPAPWIGVAGWILRVF